MIVVGTIKNCAFRFDQFKLLVRESVRSKLKVVQKILALRNLG
ncbi:hypothetical protein Mpal_2643 [Methanosphaerula palustris E1-9c]|uniref:Uncharacterized protein n=1 Tax=Methanosphaerula palustris (strain ATCC BAA-1556 / DSM 19958 / E1-9c) TaxID=521011 RepID=B8GFA2_METPE|nr:hypothetical protein Mpal_2643 [Methanosphaerula palustris E1-9c]